MEEPMTDEAYWPAWPPEGAREPSETMLQYARRDTWIGLPVMIMRGRTKGALGRVMGTGSGWVQVRQAPADGSDPMLTEEPEEVSKRAVELIVVKGYDDPDKIPLAPANEIVPRERMDEVRAVTERESQPDDAPLHAGDLVRIIGGNPSQYIGKVGKVVVVNRGTLNISIRNDLILTKKRTEVELVTGRMLHSTGPGKEEDAEESDVLEEGKRGKDADMATAKDMIVGLGVGGRSSRISAKRQELVGKRVQLIGTTQMGSIVRVTAGGSYVLALDDSEVEVTKRKEDVQMIEDGEADESGQENEEESIAEEAPPALRNAQRPAKASPKHTDRPGKRRSDKQRLALDGDGKADKDQPVELTTRDVRNVTRRATRRNTRSNGAVNGKRVKESSEQYAQTRLDASRRARQELLVGFLHRQKTKMEQSMGMPSRPNLQEWLDRIQGPSDEEDEDDVENGDAYIPLVYDAPFCPTCLLEMERGDAYCWNPVCSESPVYDPSAPPLAGTAIPPRGRHVLTLAQSPRKPGFIDYASLGPKGQVRLVQFGGEPTEQNGDAGDVDEDAQHGGSMTESTRPYSRSKRKRTQHEMVYSPLVTYNLRMPGAWLGEASAPADPAKLADGYFGRGWRSGLVYDEPGLQSCDQADVIEASLDYRWKRGLVT